MPSPLGRRSLLAAGLGLVTAAVIAGCGDDDAGDAGGVVSLSDETVPPEGPGIVLRPDTEHPGRLVAMVGDSITVGATSLLDAAADQLDVDLFIDADVGRRMTVGGSPAPGTSAVTELYSEVGEADLWVIALGTNDVGKYATREEYAAQIEAVLTLVPDDAPVAWINVYLTNWPDDSALFNRALTETLAARGNATIGAWTDYATEPEMLSDGVHPSDEGRVEWVDVVTGEIDKWL